MPNNICTGARAWPSPTRTPDPGRRCCWTKRLGRWSFGSSPRVATLAWQAHAVPGPRGASRPSRRGLASFFSYYVARVFRFLEVRRSSIGSTGSEHGAAKMFMQDMRGPAAHATLNAPRERSASHAHLIVAPFGRKHAPSRRRWLLLATQPLLPWRLQCARGGPQPSHGRRACECKAARAENVTPD